MPKKKLRIIITVLLVILLIVLISSWLYVNRETFINRITAENQALQAQENELVSKDNYIDTSKWDTNKVSIVYDKDNVPVPVPKGYVASSVENGVTPIGQVIEEENRVNTGFVIYEMTAEEIENGTEVSITQDNFWVESQRRNQWVWVPVPDTSRIYERDRTTGKATAKLWNYSDTGRSEYTNKNYEPGVLTYANSDNEKIFAMYDMQGITKAKLLEELENEFESTIESIEKYGGFYIGRYETGNVGSGSFENHNTPRQPVVQRMNTNINYVKWYDAYNNMKNIQVNENIKSNIIWGCLWDETLQWLVDSGDKTYAEIENSVAWGNHLGSEFDYITVDGIRVHRNEKSYIRISTGSSEQSKANNIYDMAGNVWEWTLETKDTDRAARIFRGGDYAMDSSVSYRSNNPGAIGSGVEFGSRAYFYIK